VGEAESKGELDDGNGAEGQEGDFKFAAQGRASSWPKGEQVRSPRRESKFVAQGGTSSRPKRRTQNHGLLDVAAVQELMEASGSSTRGRVLEYLGARAAALVSLVAIERMKLAIEDSLVDRIKLTISVFSCRFLWFHPSSSKKLSMVKFSPCV
jgi:hypothetical protein